METHAVNTCVMRSRMVRTLHKESNRSHAWERGEMLLGFGGRKPEGKRIM